MARFRYTGFDVILQLPFAPGQVTFQSQPANGPLDSYADVDGGLWFGGVGYITNTATDPPCAYVYNPNGPVAPTIDGSFQELVFSIGDSQDNVGMVSRISFTSGGNSPRYGCRYFGLFGRLYIYRRANGTGSDTILDFSSISLTVGPRYRMFFSTKKTSGGATDLKAWITTDDDPYTILVTVTRSGDNLTEAQTARSCGIIAGSNATGFQGKIYRHRFWDHDNVYSAFTRTDLADTGLYVETIPIYGIGPFTYAWSRSTDPNGTFTAISTASSFTDTTVSKYQTYWYKCTITDTGNSNATYTTEAVSGAWFGPTLKWSVYGDSLCAREIVQGGNVRLGTTIDLTKIFVMMGTCRKTQVHNAAISGRDAATFISTDLTAARAAAIANGSTHVIIRFMNNDCQFINETTYATNIITLINAVKADGMIPILFDGSTFHTVDPSSAGVGVPGRSGRGTDMLSVMFKMAAKLDTLADNKTVLRGARLGLQRSSNWRAGTDDDQHLAYGGSMADAFVMSMRLCQIFDVNATSLIAKERVSQF